jgi:hypothetical protein
MMPGFFMRVANGPNGIIVWFFKDSVVAKHLHLANHRETLQWYAKKGAEKIGITWQ